MRGGDKRLCLSLLDDTKAALVANLFVVPAIEDTVIARWAYLNNFHRQFCWSALQAVEKLLKASLIAAEVDVRNDRHDISTLAEKLEALHPTPSLRDPFSSIEKPTQIKNAASTPHAFIEQLEKYGKAASRYRQTMIVLYQGDIHRFDETIFRIVEAGETIAKIGKGKLPRADYEHQKFSEDARNALLKGNRIFKSDSPEHQFNCVTSFMAQSPLETGSARESSDPAVKWLLGLAKIE